VIAFLPSAQTGVGSGLTTQTGVAVDAAGNVFIAEQGTLFGRNQQPSEVVKITPNGVQTTVGTGLYHPTGVAVDGAGNVFIADQYNHRVVEVPVGVGTQTTVGTGLHYPTGVAVDGAGDVFIGDTGNNRVVEVPTGGGDQITVPATGLNTGAAVTGTIVKRPRVTVLSTKPLS